ncbi:hypothetical protein FDP41_009585 [Naegleria fowleri]|uniref:VPS9 domain-containing protein n=1 Tax=Naegleria fowleri TaxID=5763 RepID=A0A6A5BFP9_NAEFO|nr:uncharacterized protein FDP41_009585 [Naegleria fowleri]KAF0971889.1 hypothetical protein FDP41_009585 [Naegleria fowleri]
MILREPKRESYIVARPTPSTLAHLNTIKNMDLELKFIQILQKDIVEDGNMTCIIILELIIIEMARTSKECTRKDKERVKENFIYLMETLLKVLLYENMGHMDELAMNVPNSEQLLVDIEKEFYPICRNLISNTVHEKLFSTLFELYNYHYRDSDLLMNQKIRSLQGCTISMFGVAPEFAPLPPSDMNLVFYEYKQTSDIPYEETIKLLDQIRNAKSVIAKIETLSKVRTHAMQTMKKYRKAHKRKEAYLNYQSSNEVYDMDRNTKPTTKEPWWNAELEKRCEEWQAGADDVTSVYSYIFSKSSIDNFTATFHYVNDWKSEQVNFDPVSHIIRFYEGYLSYIQDIDPNILHDGQFISKYSLTSSLESAIEGRVLVYRDKNLPFFWLPSLLVHVGLEIGKTIANSAAAITKSSSLSISNITNITNITAGSILNLLASLNPATAMTSTKNESAQDSKMSFNPFTRKLILPSNLEVVDISNQNLVQSIIKFYDLVRQTLGASSIGFNVELKRMRRQATMMSLWCLTSSIQAMSTLRLHLV